MQRLLFYEPYDEGEASSLRDASRCLLEDYWHRLVKDDLPTSVPSLSRIITGLEPLFATVPGIRNPKILIKEEGKPARFSKEAVLAWEETGACLRSCVPPDWFGFAPPAASASRAVTPGENTRNTRSKHL